MQSEGLVVAAPRAGAAWAVGSLHWVAWAGPVQSARFELSLDRGATWSTIMTDKDDGARARWRVPEITAKTALVRAVANDRVSPAVGITILPSQKTTYHWSETTTDAGYAWRDGAALENIGDRLHLIGGWNPFAFTDDPEGINWMTTDEIWTSRDGTLWSLADRAPWEARHSFGHVQHGGRLYVLGGDALHSHYQPDVWSTSDGATWSLETERAPWGDRVLHRALAHDGALWVMGGQTMPDLVYETPQPVVFYNDVWRSTNGQTWTRVLDHAPWAPRGACDGNSVFLGRMWMLGGGTYDQVLAPKRRTYADTWSSKDGVTWTAHADPPWPPREYHAATVYDGRLWVLGGYDPDADKNLADVWYTADGENWYEQQNAMWPSRHALAVTVTARGLWVTGGDEGDTAVYLLSRGGSDQ